MGENEPKAKPKGKPKRVSTERCSVCNHLLAEEINYDLAIGDAPYEVASRYLLWPRWHVPSHAEYHMDPRWPAALERGMTRLPPKQDWRADRAARYWARMRYGGGRW